MFLRSSLPFILPGLGEKLGFGDAATDTGLTVLSFLVLLLSFLPFILPGLLFLLSFLLFLMFSSLSMLFRGVGSLLGSGALSWLSFTSSSTSRLGKAGKSSIMTAFPALS